MLVLVGFLIHACTYVSGCSCCVCVRACVRVHAVCVRVYMCVRACVLVSVCVHAWMCGCLQCIIVYAVILNS